MAATVSRMRIQRFPSPMSVASVARAPAQGAALPQFGKAYDTPHRTDINPQFRHGFQSGWMRLAALPRSVELGPVISPHLAQTEQLSTTRSHGAIVELWVSL